MSFPQIIIVVLGILLFIVFVKVFQWLLSFGARSILESTGQDDKQLTEDISGTPLYFSVSPLKLGVMSIFTFGIYQVYWFYKNWIIIKERENSDIIPFARTIFTYIFCYSLFKRVQDSAAAISLKKPMSPGLEAAGWIIITTLLLLELPYPYSLIFLFSFIFLLPVQRVVNDINDSVAPGHDKNDKFTVMNISVIAFGAMSIAIGVAARF